MPQKLKVGLFVTCPVDLLRPSVAEATVLLLERAGFKVEVPPQSCCGQVAFNNGEPEKTRELAWQLIQSFQQYDHIVVPSGSCGGMIKIHYPELFATDDRLPLVQQVCDNVHELTSFLRDIVGYAPPAKTTGLANRTSTSHASCAGLRELGIKQQPRDLLATCTDGTIREMPETEVCCGFGGTFCVKFPDVSNRMVSNKLNNALAVNADMLLGGDVSCLLNIAGKARRAGVELEVRHIAEVLADWVDAPAIGEAAE